MNKKKIIKSVFCSIILLTSLALLTSCQKKAANPPKAEIAVAWPFYQIEKEGDVKGYILGSVHIGKKEWYPFPDEIIQSLKKSDVLISEVAMGDASKIDPKIIEKFSKVDTPVTSEMTNDTKLEFEKRCKDYGISKDEVESMNVLMLYQTALAKCIDPSASLYGTDMQVYQLATKDAIKNIGLEEISEQFQILEDTFAEVDVNQLDTWFPAKDENAAVQEATMSQYEEGIVEKTFNELYENGGEAFLNEISYDRNVNWFPKIEETLKDKTIFLTVGSMHLYGEQGILQLLENAGYTVTKVTL